MDEFCANKDAQLKRCACSARVNDFDGIKQQLEKFDDKMLDFNQRLLTVNMDKEDVKAMFSATEGELAFNQKDMSESKKILDEIAGKLNTKFDSSNFDSNLSTLSWSLNADSAFDSVDSMMGAGTTTKNGTALYSAALPVCREMAMEVCTEDEFAIAQSGYQMAIEQDCNTVSKSYESQAEQAKEKIRDGSALLDMSRLDIYQKRNSDDILTCKKKMLDMLTNASVCGTDLGKCLDISGRYIDPSTGEAFLTMDLVNLGTLITRPTANQTWTTVPGNDKFVKYLNSKKSLLASAMENCTDISDYVWDEFVEDALAQIKLAQEQKLEDMRQSCTTLTTQCMTDTLESLADFDARALSIFGVSADKTAKAMCADITNACSALLESTGDNNWGQGITEIADNKTYETILQTCREVGRACIIQACKSTSGNFGLCEDLQTSVNRKSIINRTACWDEVVACVKNAGEDSLRNIMAPGQRIELDANKTFYEYLYGTGVEITNGEHNSTTIATYDIDPHKSQNYCEVRPLLDENEQPTGLNCVYDICANECGFDNNNYTNTESFECRACRLAERIWGNCEVKETIDLTKNNMHNKIKIPASDDKATLLSWFAKNTGTDNMDDSCRNSICGIGYSASYDTNGNLVCIPSYYNVNGEICTPGKYPQIEIQGEFKNCCSDGSTPGQTLDGESNICCLNNVKNISSITNLDTNSTNYFGIKNSSTTTNSKMCSPGTIEKAGEVHFMVAYSVANEKNYLLCVDGNLENDSSTCTGKYIIWAPEKNKYITPTYETTPDGTTPIQAQPDPTVTMFYKNENNDSRCTAENGEFPKQNCTVESGNPTGWLVQYK